MFVPLRTMATGSPHDEVPWAFEQGCCPEDGDLERALLSSHTVGQAIVGLPFLALRAPLTVGEQMVQQKPGASDDAASSGDEVVLTGSSETWNTGPRSVRGTNSSLRAEP